MSFSFLTDQFMVCELLNTFNRAVGGKLAKLTRGIICTSQQYGNLNCHDTKVTEVNPRAKTGQYGISAQKPNAPSGAIGARANLRLQGTFELPDLSGSRRMNPTAAIVKVIFEI